MDDEFTNPWSGEVASWDSATELQVLIRNDAQQTSGPPDWFWSRFQSSVAVAEGVVGLVQVLLARWHQARMPSYARARAAADWEVRVGYDRRYW